MRFPVIGLLAALAAALVLPATVAAGSDYRYRVVANFCDGAQPNISAKMIKPAGSGPTGFRIVARGQHRATASSEWLNEGKVRRFSKDVPSQYAKFTWTKDIHYVPPDNKWHRIKVQMIVVDQDQIVAWDTTYSVACSAA